MADGDALVPSPKGELVLASGVEQVLAQIRPAWKAKRLIERVRVLLPTDPSSACQRLFNAAIHDLREKIIKAGLDIAEEVAAMFKLPTVKKNEDVLDSYSPTNVLDLAYRMGLLTRPAWRRLHRAYEIRRDLEHEDDEYEAAIEDCVYIFKTCIEAVLAQEPVELLRVQDVKTLIEVPEHIAPSLDLIQDFRPAPDLRQRAITEYLVQVALDSDKPDLTRQNAVEVLRAFEPSIRDTVKIEIGNVLNERAKRKPFDLAQMKVAAAAGVTPYLKQKQVAAFFQTFYKRLEVVGYGWKNFQNHAAVLDELEDVGGLSVCPEAARRDIVLWMVLCYLGEPGRYGWYGRNREVFNSDTAAPRIVAFFKVAGKLVRKDVEAARGDDRVKSAMRVPAIARRYELLMDLTGPEE
ncbi:hypothetical protein HY522_06030 [bacterium]|nr:hypothetical protein [bacterium]